MLGFREFDKFLMGYQNLVSDPKLMQKWREEELKIFYTFSTHPNCADLTNSTATDQQ